MGNETQGTGELFDKQPQEQGVLGPAAKVVKRGAARVLRPNRKQMELRASDLESLLPEGHRARVVWGFVEGSDTSALYEQIKARDGGVGRSAIAPEIMLALWLYATLEGVGMARALARLTQEHDAYRWICGGVQVNYHTLSDFRTGLGKALDSMLTEGVASLMAAGVVKLGQVAQDGMRVRASAGAGSFRRQEKLEQYLEQAQARVQALKREVDQDPGALTRRQAAARARAAREREERIAKALARLPELAKIKQRQGKRAEEARASSTDADATVMKMANGGFGPAYNVQFATDAASQVIVGAAVVTVGSDQGQMTPMIEQVKERTGEHPQQWLVDGGFNKHEQIEAASEHTEVYAPVPQPKAKGKDENANVAGVAKDSADSADSADKADAAKEASEDAAIVNCVTDATDVTGVTGAIGGTVDTSAAVPAQVKAQAPVIDRYQPKPGDSAAVAAWRVRMGTEEAKAIYKNRAATAECVNAQARNRGLIMLPVRSTEKVRCVILLHAVAHNLMRMLALAPQLIRIGTGTSSASNFVAAAG